MLDAQDERAENSFYCLGLVLEGELAAHRLVVVEALNEAGVGTSIYYPQPVPRMQYYRERYGYDAARFPNAAAISDGGIALPVGPHLSQDDSEYVAEKLLAILKRVGA